MIIPIIAVIIPLVSSLIAIKGVIFHAAVRHVAAAHAEGRVAVGNEDDDLDLPSLGLGVGKAKKKTALFLVMRSGDTSYNLFINMLYTCAHKAGRL